MTAEYQDAKGLSYVKDSVETERWVTDGEAILADLVDMLVEKVGPYRGLHSTVHVSEVRGWVTVQVVASP